MSAFAKKGWLYFIPGGWRPDHPRPYRAWGYPWAQVIFVIAAAYLFFNSLIEAPRQSFLGLGLIFLGVPAYFFRFKRS